MTFKRMNMNEYVKVKLTPYGKEIFTTHCPQWYLIVSERGDKEGYVKIQMWELFEIFGSCLFLGNPNLPFENNEILIDTGKLYE